MKRKIILIINSIIFIFVAFSSFSVTAEYRRDVFERISISDADLPEGFVFGKIPNFARTTIQNNPWMMDRGAITRLTRNIYPDGDASVVSDIHMAIMARREQPYGDDLVCYMILFKDAGSAKKEIAKIEEFTRYNRDRVLVYSKENLAVVLHVDDADDFGYIEKMAKNIESRLQ